QLLVGGSSWPGWNRVCSARCYGTLGLESGGVADTQLNASSVWEWNVITGQRNVWSPSGARLKKTGLPWAPSQSDQQQWLQVDLKREKRITGWMDATADLPSDSNLTQIRAFVLISCQVFQGNINYLHEVRNNFIPPVEARYVRVNPTSWHQRIALKLELCN
uniref:F5/8 type C domain-containing protein n=1 Tax=Acanthochromis polyacanthus TaxID=80966 RepID=A0A3Q1F4C2_9TELE